VRTSTERGIVGDTLLHPVVLVAVAVLVINDHWLKHHHPGVVSGKLSDVAGLAFFPLLLVALWELVTGVRSERRPRATLVAMACTGIAFTLANTTDAGAELYRAGLGILQWPLYALRDVMAGHVVTEPASVAFTQDPSDLLALPALAVSFLVATRSPLSSWRTWAARYGWQSAAAAGPCPRGSAGDRRASRTQSRPPYAPESPTARRSA